MSMSQDLILKNVSAATYQNTSGCYNPTCELKGAVCSCGEEILNQKRKILIYSMTYTQTLYTFMTE